MYNKGIEFNHTCNNTSASVMSDSMIYKLELSSLHHCGLLHSTTIISTHNKKNEMSRRFPLENDLVDAPDDPVLQCPEELEY